MPLAVLATPCSPSDLGSTCCGGRVPARAFVHNGAPASGYLPRPHPHFRHLPSDSCCPLDARSWALDAAPGLGDWAAWPRAHLGAGGGAGVPLTLHGWVLGALQEAGAGVAGDDPGEGGPNLQWTGSAAGAEGRARWGQRGSSSLRWGVAMPLASKGWERVGHQAGARAGRPGADHTDSTSHGSWQKAPAPTHILAEGCQGRRVGAPRGAGITGRSSPGGRRSFLTP